MSQSRKIVLPPSQDVDTVPFADGEEAWLWFSRCQLMRKEGARFVAGMVETPRPCLPDDVYREVMKLYRRREIENDHLQVLGSYGVKLVPPDERYPREYRDARLWNEALKNLSKALKIKGIVE